VPLAERVALAAAMLTDPEVLLLNEPLRSVDPAERARLLASGGVNERRAQNIGQAHDKRVDGLAERVGLRGMRRLPKMRQELGRHHDIAADHFAVELQCGSGVAEHFLGVLLVNGAHALGGRRPQFLQERGIAGGDARTDFPFERECVFAQPLALDAARGHFQQRLVDDPGERADRAGAAAACDQDQWEVVAQQGEIPVPGEESGTQSESVDGVYAFALPSAGGKEDPLFVKRGGHVHVGSL